jgi:hypothetical protein
MSAIHKISRVAKRAIDLIRLFSAIHIGARMGTKRRSRTQLFGVAAHRTLKCPLIMMWPI